MPSHTSEKHQNPTSLKITVDIAKIKINERIRIGVELVETNISSHSALKNMQEEYYKWDDYNRELLNQIFTDKRISEEYSGSVSIYTIEETSLTQDIEEFRDDVKKGIRRLESIRERLEIFPCISENNKPKNIIKNNKVFIVHGHDEEAKITVARFVEKLNLKAVILHEQVSNGSTIIEKFENHASQVDFAIVLLTPDDMGFVAGKENDIQSRARQNVILELGYFTGLLSRTKISVLTKGNVEIPSDYLGVVYTPMDKAGAWQLTLAKEIKDSGINIDLNLIL